MEETLNTIEANLQSCIKELHDLNDQTNNKHCSIINYYLRDFARFMMDIEDLKIFLKKVNDGADNKI